MRGVVTLTRSKMVGREYKIVRAIKHAFVRRVIAEGMQSS